MKAISKPGIECYTARDYTVQFFPISYYSPSLLNVSEFLLKKCVQPGMEDSDDRVPGVVATDSSMENDEDQVAGVVDMDSSMENDDDHVDEMVVMDSSTGNDDDRGPEVVAMDCEMVGGGSDGSLDLCAGVCIIDEDENVIFHSYVKPVIPVTNFR